MSIFNWSETCDECGSRVSEWYDLGTTVLCKRCLDEYKSFHGSCEVCGDTEADMYYKVGNQTICEECIREFRRS